MNKLAWVALGGIGVGLGALAAVAAVGANEISDLRLDHLLALSDSTCRSEPDPVVDPKATERSLPWSGGDQVEIAVPGARVHYRGGEGDQVIVRGAPDVISHIRVEGDAVALRCYHGASGGVDITLPGNSFRTIGLAGSGTIDMEKVSQPELNLSLAGSGSVSAQGTSDVVSVSIAGSGDAHLGQLTMNKLALHIAGSGDAEAGPRDELDVHIAGSGKVRLLSHPAKVSSHIVGSGKIIEAAAEAPVPGK